jgi:hypothetical protein
MCEDLVRASIRLQAQGNWSEEMWDEAERFARFRPSVEDFVAIVVCRVTQDALTAFVVEQMAAAERELLAGGPWLVRV